MVFVATYFVFMSLIAHKEDRFLLPIFPALFIMAARAAIYYTGSRPVLVRVYMCILIFIELTTTGIFTYYHKKNWEAAKWIAS